VPAIINTDFPCKAAAEPSQVQIRTGMTASEVVAAKGSPTRTISVNGSTYTYEFTDITVVFKDGHVIKLMKPDIPVRIGMTPEQVQKAMNGDSGKTIPGDDDKPYEYEYSNMRVLFSKNKVADVIKLKEPRIPVRIGMTQDQVKKAMKADPSKTITSQDGGTLYEYEYSNMRVLFNKGKVIKVMSLGGAK
jgi:outer membrane protein assembly factor BamE (lipoprotein component of BamABCDE complex)